MDHEEIKQRLTGYRPEIYQDDDPEIAEALKLAREDPDLSAWLDEEIAFDREFASALNAQPLECGKIEEVLSAASDDLIEDQPIRAQFRWRAFAAAAVLLFGVMLGKYFLFPPAVEFPQAKALTSEVFREQMAYFVNERFVLDQTTSDLTKAQDWLAEKDYPVFQEIPGAIVNYEGMGCKAIDWQGEKVGLVCFVNDKEELVHLFVVDAAVLDASVREQLPELKRLHGVETQGWSDSERVYVYVGSEPDVSLAGLL